MINKLATGLFLLTFPLTVQSQNTIKISGKVIDRDTNEPLEYASISLKRKPIGTVTNADGKFDFYISSEFTSDTVMISSLGYRPCFEGVKALVGSASNIIKLEPKILVLNEVVVRDKTPAPLEILNRAFASIETNFPTEPYVYTGFIRETWSENNKTVSLLESAVDIYDDGYSGRKKRSVKVREQVDLKFARASDNNMNAAFKPLIVKHNALTGALRWNQVKYPNPDITQNLKTKEIILEDVVSSNNRTLYVVSFITHDPSYEMFERKDTYYIDDQTFAIKKCLSREYGRTGKYRSPQWPLDSIHSYQAKDVENVYEFEEYNGKMYLKYFNQTGLYDIHNSRTKADEYQIEGNTMIVITDIKDKNKKAVLNTMDHGKSLSSQTTPYNESFWTSYDQVKLVPLTDKQVKDLESEESLTSQFIRSGSLNSKKSAGKKR